MRQQIFVFPPKKELGTKNLGRCRKLWTFFLKQFFQICKIFLVKWYDSNTLVSPLLSRWPMKCFGFLFLFETVDFQFAWKKTYGPSAMRHNHEPPWHLLGKIYKSKLIFLNASCFETNTAFQFAVKSHLFRLITKTWVASKTYELFIQMAGHCTNISKNLLTSLSLSKLRFLKPHPFFLWNIPFQVAIMSSLTIRKGKRWGRLWKKTWENQHFSGKMN